MNKRTFLALAAGIALCLPGACPAALAATAPTPVQPVKSTPGLALDTDRRLDRRVTFHGVGVSLADVAAALSGAGLTLRADSDCADLKVQMRVRNQPLRSVMAGLAQLLPGTWEPSDAPGRGYDLSMSREALADRARWWDTFLAEHDREMALQRDQVLASMQAPAAAAAPDPAEGNGAATHEDRGQQFFDALPAPLRDAVAGQMDDTIFYESEPGTGSNEVEVATVLPVSGLPTEARHLVDQELDSRPKRPAIFKDLSNNFLVLANCGLGVFASLLSPADEGMDDIFLSHPCGGAELPVLYPWRQSGLPALVDRGGPDVPPAWQVLADYQRRRFWADDPPRPDPKAPKPAYVYPPRRTVDWLMRVGDKADIDYVADYHSLPQSLMTAPEMAAPLSGPLKPELDAEAASHDISWKKAGDGLYLFRDNRWYQDDELEVPNAVLKQIKAELPAPRDSRTASPPTATWPEGAVTAERQIDAEADIAARLSPWQIVNGLSLYVQEVPDDPTAGGAINPTTPGRTPLRPENINSFAALGRRILPERRTLAFYAGLSGAERAALVAGALPAAALDADQQAQAVALAPPLAPLLAAGGDAPPVLLGIHRKNGPFLRLFVPAPPAASPGGALP